MPRRSIGLGDGKRGCRIDARRPRAFVVRRPRNAAPPPPMRRLARCRGRNARRSGRRRIRERLAAGPGVGFACTPGVAAGISGARVLRRISLGRATRRSRRRGARTEESDLDVANEPRRVCLMGSQRAFFQPVADLRPIDHRQLPPSTPAASLCGTDLEIAGEAHPARQKLKSCRGRQALEPKNKAPECGGRNSRG